jgi:ribosomal protein S18 acetylase RimI-like enzyme
MPAPPTPFEVVRSTPERVEEAMGALLSAGPTAAARFVEQAARSRIDLDRIWCVAGPDGRYRMAVLAVPARGRTVMVMATRVRDAAQAATVSRAIDAACEGCRDAGDIAQSLLEPERKHDAAAFEGAGFRALATLEYQERHLPRVGPPEATSLPADWTIEPAASDEALGSDDPASIDATSRAALERILESTYRDTLDCPGLAGMRRVSDVLEGHFGQGRRRRIWLVARRDATVGAVCLLNGSPDGAQAELAYFGVAPEARGSGIAAALLSAGIRACAAARAGSVQLAVDARNEPAKRLYARLGFRTVSSRLALVRPLR